MEKYYVSAKSRDQKQRPWLRAIASKTVRGACHHATSIFVGECYQNDILLIGIGMPDGFIKPIRFRKVSDPCWTAF